MIRQFGKSPVYDCLIRVWSGASSSPSSGSSLGLGFSDQSCLLRCFPVLYLLKSSVFSASLISFPGRKRTRAPLIENPSFVLLDEYAIAAQSDIKRTDIPQTDDLSFLETVDHFCLQGTQHTLRLPVYGMNAGCVPPFHLSISPLRFGES